MAFIKKDVGEPRRVNTEDEGNNLSGNRPFNEIAAAVASRRSIISGSLVAAAGFVAAPLAHAAKGGKKGPNGVTGRNKKNGLISFNPVPVAEGNGPLPSISSDYVYDILIPWGQALTDSTPDYTGDPSTRPTSLEQANQVGIGHDGMWFYPFGNSSSRGLLAINHEFGSDDHVLGKPDPESLEDVRVSQHAHGVSVLEIREVNGQWQLVKNSAFNRRITGNSPMAFSGPVAGSALIDAGRGTFEGTLNNCASGPTLWGTYLTCEENFNGYFGTDDPSWTPSAQQARYGLSTGGFGYNWHRFDARFDLAVDMQEENRFGWVVEIDPFDPNATPVKRTALGRFKHENACMVEGRGGRAVVYMGDDERFDYVYKFVSEGNWRSMRARGMSPLDHGTLYAAKFNEDGTGEWLELSLNNPAISAQFQTMDEVLTYARLAADAAGATPMDRPEWITEAPNGDIYCALTNNSRRTEPGPANPRVNNQDGHIIRWHDSDQNTGTTFLWELFIYAEDTHGAGDERTFSDPDGIWADPDGRLFIQTDGGQQKGLNDQMVVCSTYAAPDSPTMPLEIRRLFTGVTGCEITGIAVTPDRRTMFINVQHPGDGDPSLTNFPLKGNSGELVFDGVTIPRDATVVIRRKDGGIIGS